MEYLIDTNIFLRALMVENSQQQQDCAKLMKNIKKKQIAANTNSLVISEIVWTLLSFYKVDKQTVLRSVQAIKNMRGLKIVDNYNLDTALTLYQNHNVKFIDAMIASTTQIQDKAWTLISYDKDFDKLEVPRKEPSELLKR